MKYWTVHLRPGRQSASAPVLVREGFSLAACLFGPLWLLAHRAWIPAVLVICALILAGALVPLSLQPILFVAIAVLAGLSGHDLRRFALERRGYVLMHVVAARDADGALARLLASRPDLAGSIADALA